MTSMFELVMPEKVAAGVVQKDVKLIYDPKTAELTQVVMPFDTKSEVTYLSVDKGVHGRWQSRGVGRLRRRRRTKKVFISFHNPVFARSGMGAIPDSQNPHKTIAAYAKDLDIVVFNGHVHTTELYQVDGVKYLLLGGGGAEQDPILPGRTHLKLPATYPPDLYWKGAAPKEEYNYVLVDVKPGEATKFTLSRYRPWSAEPFATVELFKW